MKTKNGVRQKIRYVEQLPLSFHIRMLFYQQPAYMREKESPFCIMRVSVCLCELVMNSVITCPFNDVILNNKLKVVYIQMCIITVMYTEALKMKYLDENIARKDVCLFDCGVYRRTNNRFKHQITN